MFDTLPSLAPLKPSNLLSELDCHLSTEPEDVKDALAWWHEQQNTYPCLSHMALDYLMIPSES